MKRQKTTLSRSIDMTSDKAKYDASCKKILAEKIILAWIMKHTMKEYAPYDVQEIAEKYIEGTPKIAEVAVLPDETNAPRIMGTGVEDSSLTEGIVTYDIQFRAIIPETRELVEMIINIEAQDDFYPGYPIVKRGIYYCGRMISSQYGTVFSKAQYDKIQKVYSIWICMTPPKHRRNTITQYSMKEENIVGNVKEEESNYDLMTAIMICLGDSGNEQPENKLLEMLDVLLSSEKKAEQKKQILENEFGIPMTEEMEGEMEKMCNLSDGVERKGIEKGIKIGLEQGVERAQRLVVENMLRLNKPMEEICECVGCDEEFVQQIKESIR